jgi:hypothetical protein
VWCGGGWKDEGVGLGLDRCGRSGDGGEDRGVIGLVFDFAGVEGICSCFQFCFRRRRRGASCYFSAESWNILVSRYAVESVAGNHLDIVSAEKIRPREDILQCIVHRCVKGAEVFGGSEFLIVG